MFQGDDVRKFRKDIYHSQRDFVELLGRLRGVPIPLSTLQSWEQGLIDKPAPFYLTDVAAIKIATHPHSAACEICRARQAVIRKRDTDMCSECAPLRPLELQRVIKTQAVRA